VEEYDVKLVIREEVLEPTDDVVPAPIVGKGFMQT